MTKWLNVFYHEADKLGLLVVQITKEQMKRELGSTRSPAFYDLEHRQIKYMGDMNKDAMFHELGHAIDDLIDRRCHKYSGEIRDDELRAWGIGIRIMRLNDIKINWDFVKECLGDYIK